MPQRTKQQKEQSARDKKRNKQQQAQRGNQRGPTLRRIEAPANTGYVGSMGSSPRFQSYGSGVVICHTEALTAIAPTSTTFAKTAIAMIPANFPWLKGIANSFSKFRYRKLRVHYLTQTSTATPGRIAMSWGYDAKDIPATNISQIISTYGSTFGPVWSGSGGFDSSRPFSTSTGMHTDLDVKKAEKPYYPFINQVGFDGIADEHDKNQYCPAYLFVGHEGAPAGTIGSLYVSYEVELVEPIASELQG